MSLSCGFSEARRRRPMSTGPVAAPPPRTQPGKAPATSGDNSVPQSHRGRLDAHQDHLAGRLAEQAQVVEQSGYSGLVRVPRIDLLWIGAAKIHPDGSAGRQARVHGVDDQQFLAPANLGQQIRSNRAAIDEASHRSGRASLSATRGLHGYRLRRRTATGFRRRRRQSADGSRQAIDHCGPPVWHELHGCSAHALPMSTGCWNASPSGPLANCRLPALPCCRIL